MPCAIAVVCLQGSGSVVVIARKSPRLPQRYALYAGVSDLAGRAGRWSADTTRDVEKDQSNMHEHTASPCHCRCRYRQVEVSPFAALSFSCLHLYNYTHKQQSQLAVRT